MKRWGATLLVLGVVSFALPLLGMQLRIFNLFGPESQPVIGVLVAVVGGVLLAFGMVQERRTAGAAGQVPVVSAPTGVGTGIAMAGAVSSPPAPSSIPSARHCAACGRVLRSGDQFCEQCGTKVAMEPPPMRSPVPSPIPPAPSSAPASASASRSTKRICPNARCGKAMAKDKKFCTACGTRLVT